MSKRKSQIKNPRMQPNSQFEYSAGGVVFRKGESGIDILLIHDKNKEWTFPKGLIEENEEPAQTAQREIGEETGIYSTKFLAAITTIRYFYKFKDKLIRKRVDFFLFEASGNEEPLGLIEEGISDAMWVAKDKVSKMLGYITSNKPVFEKAKKIMKEKYGI